MKRALLTSTLVLALAACGGTRDDAATGDSGASPSASTSPSAAPAEARECPLKATTVPAPPGNTDLTQKPVVAANPAPPPTEVTVADLVVGTGAEATTLSSVETKYVGALYTDGTEFDASWNTSPDQTIPFTVCSSGVIPGFAIAPTGMKEGGRRQVTIPAELGYGEQGSPPSIPPNAPLVFIIDLVKVTPPAG